MVFLPLLSYNSAISVKPGDIVINTILPVCYNVKRLIVNNLEQVHLLI
jgi:hypothetical protein